MISAEFSESISETLDILNHMDRIYIDRIPKKFIDFLNNNKSINYISRLDHSKKINEMNLKEKTKDLLATIYMNYWCDSQAKADYINLLKQNEHNYQEKLKEKYNPDNLFKNNNQAQNTISNDIINDNIAMVDFKESVLKKFINKIKSIFHIH